MKGRVRYWRVNFLDVAILTVVMGLIGWAYYAITHPSSSCTDPKDANCADLLKPE